MRYRFLFLLVCLALFPFGVKADCDYQRKADLRKIASNVQINSSYRLNEDNVPIFNIELSNITPDIYVVDDYNNVINYDSNKIFEVYSGSSIKYDIYSSDINCYGFKITTKYVNLKNYNRFYTSTECKEHPEFKYCSLWYKNDFTYEYFRKLYNDYLNSIVSENVDDVVANSNYYLYIIVGGIVFIVTLLGVFVVRRKKNEM